MPPRSFDDVELYHRSNKIEGVIFPNAYEQSIAVSFEIVHALSVPPAYESNHSPAIGRQKVRELTQLSFVGDRCRDENSLESTVVTYLVDIGDAGDTVSVYYLNVSAGASHPDFRVAGAGIDAGIGIVVA